MNKVIFKISLKFFEIILSIVHTAHKALQSPEATLSSSTNLIISVITKLKSLRSESEFLSFIDEFNVALGVKRRKMPTHFQDFIVDSTLGSRDSLEIESLKRNFYYRILDQLISELESRFPNQSFELANACSNLWHCKTDGISSIIEMYNSVFPQNLLDATLLKSQIDIAKFELKEDFSESNIKSVVKRSNYPLFYKLLQFSLTIPTGSVKSERSISALRRVFNYNRCKMGLTRLGSLSLMAIEPDIFASISNDEAIDYFSSMKSRRLSLF